MIYKIKCDRLLEIDAQKSQVVFEAENIDLSFIEDLTAKEVAHNCDLQKVLRMLMMILSDNISQKDLE